MQERRQTAKRYTMMPARGMARAHTEANQSRPANKKRVETTAAEWRQAPADISGKEFVQQQKRLAVANSVATSQAVT